MKVWAARECSFISQHAIRKLLGHGHTVIEIASDEAKDCELSCFDRAHDMACDSHFHIDTFVEQFEKPGAFLTLQIA